MPQTARRGEYFTYDDYCHWPDDERWELIDGEAFAMTGPSRIHQDFLIELTAQLHPQLADTDCRLYIAPFDVRLPKGDEADARIDTVVQPDLMVICDPAKLDDKGCRGAPDWIVEILSPHTATHDQIRKRRLYERHGVREYWLLHPQDRVLTIYRRNAAGTFDPPEVSELTGATPVAAIAGLAIHWPPDPNARQIRPSPASGRATPQNSVSNTLA